MPPPEEHVLASHALPFSPSVSSFSSEYKKFGTLLTSKRDIFDILDLSSTQNIFNETRTLHTQIPSTWEEMLEKRKKVAHLLSAIEERTNILSKDPETCDKQTYAIIFIMLGALCVETSTTTKDAYKFFERAAELGDNELGNANYILGKYVLRYCAYFVNQIPPSQQNIRQCFEKANKHFQITSSRSQNNIGAHIYEIFTRNYLENENIEKAYDASCKVKGCTGDEDDYYHIKLRMYGFSIKSINDSEVEQNDSEVEQSFEELATKIAKDNHKKSKCHAYIGKILMDKFIKNSDFVRYIGRGLTEKLKNVLIIVRNHLELGKKANMSEVWEYLHTIENTLHCDKIQENTFCRRLYDDIGKTGVVFNSKYVKKILEETKSNINARLESDNLVVNDSQNNIIYHYAPTLLLKAIDSHDYNAFEALIENGADPLEVMECKEAFKIHEEYFKKTGTLIKDDTVLFYLGSLLHAGLARHNHKTSSSKQKTSAHVKMKNLVLNRIRETKPAILRNSRTGESFGCHLHFYIKNNLVNKSVFGLGVFKTILSNENDIDIENFEGKSPLMLLCHIFLKSLYRNFCEEHLKEEQLKYNSINENTWSNYIDSYSMPYYRMLKELLECRGIDFKKEDLYRNTVMSMITNYFPPPKKKHEDSEESLKMRAQFYVAMRKCCANMLVKAGANATVTNENPQSIPEKARISYIPEQRRVTIDKMSPEKHKITINRVIPEESLVFSYFRGCLLSTEKDKRKILKNVYIQLSNFIKKRSFEKDGNLYQHPFPTHTESFEGISMKPMEGFTLAGVDLTGFNLSGAKDLNGSVFDGAHYLKNIHGETVITLSSKGYDNFKPSINNLRYVLENPSLENYEQLAFYALLHPNMLETTQEDGFNALREAAHSGDGYFVNIVLGTQPDILAPGAIGENGYTPLMLFISKAKKANDTCNAGIRGLLHYMQYAAYSGELYSKPLKESKASKCDPSLTEKTLIAALTQTARGVTITNIVDDGMCTNNVRILFNQITRNNQITRKNNPSNPLPLTLEKVQLV